MCSGLIPLPIKCSVGWPLKIFENQYNGADTKPNPLRIMAKDCMTGTDYFSWLTAY
ncbi:hypothetical protein [Microcoleus sp. F4-D5]|uniref:hypothetical protein n=1 Tax=Microcoleus sp. F4-D5 TaxID=2818760 RepID=UPI00404097A4